MAPIKNVSDAEKVVKKGVQAKSTKPSLKTPKCITVKIAKLDSKSPRITRKVSFQKKIELANEVALEQLTKPLETSEPLPSPAKVEILARKPLNLTEPPKTKPRLNRKIKYTPDLANNDSDLDTPLSKNTNTKLCEESTTKPTRKRKQLLKASESSLKSPPKKKFVNKVADDSLESGLLVKPVSVPKAKRTPGKKVKKVISDYLSDKPNNDETVNLEEVSKTPAKRVNKRKQTPKKPQSENKGPTKVLEEKPTKKMKRIPKGSTDPAHKRNGKPTLKVTKKGKVMNAKEIKSAATVLENALMQNAAQVLTRSNSVNSSASNLSWTKDVSTESSLSSGTTTCVTVTSTDFVRFDKKLPFVQVENTNYDRLRMIEDGIEKTMLENESSSSDDSDSSSSSSESKYDASVNQDLNLSTSSLTGAGAATRPEGSLNNTERICVELNSLTSLMNEFYTEISKWESMVGDEVDFEKVAVITEAAVEEKNLIDSIKSMLGTTNCVVSKKTSIDTGINRDTFVRKDIEICRKNAEDSSPSRTAQPASVDPEDASDEFLEPCGVRSRSPPIKNREKFPKNVPAGFTIPTRQENPTERPGSADTFTSDNYSYVPFEDKVDDEDALSLFAESISGMESSKLGTVASIIEPSTSKGRRIQEAYVPKPMKPLTAERYYRPTRINNELEKADGVPLKTIHPNMIEKQNADSSSISKDLNNKAIQLHCDESAIRVPSFGESSGTAIAMDTSIANPARLFSQYHPVNAVKSFVYKGFCFFNLAKQCKNINCRFPHVSIDPNILKLRLSVLDEDSLIMEYLLTCKFPNLRRKFCLLFMHECKRRSATRLLMEMAIDLGLGVVERDDDTINVNALETTLLHLNNVNFDACDDLLTYTHNGITMCDTLLICIAHSQNFAQFKEAFVKLANFMAQINRSVDIETAGNILERVCILPCEESLARGMLCLMKNTKASIFDSKMTNSFEVQLSNIESDVHVAYLIAKKEAIEGHRTHAQKAAGIPRVGMAGPRHPSPDTTNFDSLKKAQMAPPTTFKRTINMEAIDLFKSPSNPAPKQRYMVPKCTQWQRGVGYNMRGRNTRMHVDRLSLVPQLTVEMEQVRSPTFSS